MLAPETIPSRFPAKCWGKINRGQRWFPLAVDFGRCLSVARLAEYERILIYALQERSWGDAALTKSRDGRWPDARPVIATIAALAEEIAPGDALVRKMLLRARRTLLESKMIREVGGGLVIETDVSRWADRIPESRRAYCLSGRTRPSDNRKSMVLEPPRAELISSQPEPISSTAELISSKPPEIGTVKFHDGTNEFQNDERHIGTRASEEFKKIKEEQIAAYAAAQTEDDEAAIRLAGTMRRRDDEPEPFDAENLAIPPASRPPRDEDERLREWARTEIIKATGDDLIAYAVVQKVAVWRGEGQEAYAIAAHIDNICKYRLVACGGKVEPQNLPSYLEGIFRRREPGESLPKIPAEWRTAASSSAIRCRPRNAQLTDVKRRRMAERASLVGMRTAPGNAKGVACG